MKNFIVIVLHLTAFLCIITAGIDFLKDTVDVRTVINVVMTFGLTAWADKYDPL